MTYYIREFKLRLSGNGKRQVRTFFAKFSLTTFSFHIFFLVSKELSCIVVLKQQVHVLFIALFRKIFLCLAFAVCRITQSLNFIFPLQINILTVLAIIACMFDVMVTINKLNCILIILLF
jgi:hypothetical protein